MIKKCPTSFLLIRHTNKGTQFRKQAQPLLDNVYSSNTRCISLKCPFDLKTLCSEHPSVYFCRLFVVDSICWFCLKGRRNSPTNTYNKENLSFYKMKPMDLAMILLFVNECSFLRLFPISVSFKRAGKFTLFHWSISCVTNENL